MLTMNQSEDIYGQDQSARLRTLVEGYRAAARRIDALEADLTAQRQLFATVAENQLPALLAELGVDALTLEDGARLQLTAVLSASVKDRDQAAAAPILRRIGAGDLLQQKAVFAFTKAEQPQLKALLEYTRKHRLPVDLRDEINTATLKAVVRAALADGKLQPAELRTLGVFRVEKVLLREAKA